MRSRLEYRWLLVAGALGFLLSCQSNGVEQSDTDALLELTASLASETEPLPVPTPTLEHDGGDFLTEPAALRGLSGVLTLEEGVKMVAEECCTQPGSASACWMDDAQKDGVTCSQDSQCSSGSCNAAKGRCRCGSDADCNDGICKNGTCGPSWCNGYMVCSCWGGCEWWDPQNPTMTLHDLAASQGMFCCEGIYAEDPITVDPSLGGVFSDTPCGGCATDAQCDDNNPCTTDICSNGSCTYVNLTGDATTVPSAAQCPFDTSVYHADCAKPVCNAGSCSVTISAGIECNVGQNTCSAATCDAGGACVDAPLDAAGLAGNTGCCDPAVTASFNDGFACTDDYCCVGGLPSPQCDGLKSYTTVNVPNYDPANPGNCCKDSNDCFDGNGCTRNVCCNAANAADPLCAQTNYECVQTVEDRPGCCDSAPANLADNCDDAYGCTQNICCTPAAVAAAVAGDPCFGETPYNCVAAQPQSPLVAGCCNPDGDPDVDCNDGNICTRKLCKGTAMACDYEPLPQVAGCCGPGPGETCLNLDNNVCTDENCCSPAQIAAAVAGDPCFGADMWSCVTTPSTNPGCCATAADCDDANPCTEDLCVANSCQNNKWTDLTGHGGCCNASSLTSASCVDANDPGDCTQNVCCSDADVAAAAPGDPCFGKASWACANPPVALPKAGCCTTATVASDCNGGGNICVVEDCVNSNCTFTANTAPASCCANNADCPQNGPARPCLASGSCDVTGDPLTNPNYGQCVLTYMAAGTVCNAGDECFDWVCDGTSSGCSTFDPVPTFGQAGALQCGTPPACTQYWCDGAGGCTHTESLFTNYDNDNCAEADPIVGASVSGSNSCGTNDAAPDATGRFAECAGGTASDVVYTIRTTVTDDYVLQHKVVTVTDTVGNWDPLIYVRSTCLDGTTQIACNNNCSFFGSNYNAADYGGPLAGECAGGESTVVIGPFGVEDLPSHDANNPVPVATQDFDQNGVRDGYDVIRDHDVSLFVDSVVTTNGGDFNVNIVQETHNNNDCRNIAAYAGAPLIDGAFQWKQRWRGEVVSGEYDNYFGLGGPSLKQRGSVDAINPHPAFFKLELPSGTGVYKAYMDWWGVKKRGEAGLDSGGDAASQAAAANIMYRPLLSSVAPDAADPLVCSSSSADIITAQGKKVFYPPELLIDTSKPGQGSRWLAVTDKKKNKWGAYELSLVKAQQPFFGFSSLYSKQLASGGCGNARGDFDGEAVRLDFVPTGTADNGYLMTITETGSGGGGSDSCAAKSGGPGGLWDTRWLVHPECYGPSGDGEAIEFAKWSGDRQYQGYAVLPFYFPLGDKFYKYVYFDSTGRVEPREVFGSCSVDADCVGVPQCDAAAAGCVCRAEFGGQCTYNPGGYIYHPTAKDIFYPYTSGGHAPVIAGAWGSFNAEWNTNSTNFGGGDPNGFMTAQSVVFEGSTVYVISWVGMDIHPTKILSRPWWQGGDVWLENLPYEHQECGWFGCWTADAGWRSYGERLMWQVILRPDGRLTYYYGPDTTKAVWDQAVSNGLFSVALTGGVPTITCANDGDCQSVYGASAICDENEDNWSNYTPSYACQREVTPLMRDASTGALLGGLGYLP